MSDFRQPRRERRRPDALELCMGMGEPSGTSRVQPGLESHFNANPVDIPVVTIRTRRSNRMKPVVTAADTALRVRQPPGWRESMQMRCRLRGRHVFTTRINGVVHCSWCGQKEEEHHGEP